MSGERSPRTTGRRSWRWLVHLVTIAMTVAWIVPILGLFVSSVRTQSDTAASGWWTALIDPYFTSKNYRLAFEQIGVGQSLATSLAIALPTTVLTTVVSVIGAFALTRMRFVGRAALSLVLVALLVTPPQVTLVPLLKVYAALGLSGTVPGVWLYQVGFTVPYGIFLIRGYMSSIPNELFESATMDGAGALRVFRSIVIPLSLPIMMSLAIMQFLWSWNDLLIPLLFLGGSAMASPITVELASVAASTSQGQGPLMAATFLSAALPLIIIVSLQRYFVRGVLGGAVKG